MLTTFFTFFGTFFGKYKKYIIGVIVLVCLFFYVLNLQNKLAYAKKENTRKDTNIENMKFKVDTTVLANGNLKYTVNSLTVKSSELKYFSEDIYKKLNELGIKLKNVKGVTNIDYHYTTILGDTIKTEKITDNTFSYNTDKNNMKTSGVINIPTNFSSGNKDSWPFVTNAKVELNDSLILVPEYQYKRSWLFWKKVNGVKVHISSSNPDFKIDRIQTFEITK